MWISLFFLFFFRPQHGKECLDVCKVELESYLSPQSFGMTFALLSVCIQDDKNVKILQIRIHQQNDKMSVVIMCQIKAEIWNYHRSCYRWRNFRSSSLHPVWTPLCSFLRLKRKQHRLCLDQRRTSEIVDTEIKQQDRKKQMVLDKHSTDTVWNFIRLSHYLLCVCSSALCLEVIKTLLSW